MSQANTNTNSKTNKEITKDILFQKLGNTWYIFTEINNQVVYSAMPEGMDPRTTKLELYNVIEDHMKKISDLPKYRSAEAA
jgi:hypothetical protein